MTFTSRERSMAGFLKRDLSACKRFKAKLQARELATLVHSSHPAPSLVERLAECGFDAVLIDAEHGSVGRERVEEMSRAAALAGTAAIIRPEACLPHLITGYLGCGVDGFMLPLIRNATQAEELLRYYRFSAPMDYADRVMIFMIELEEAIDALPDLLRLDGVDAYLVAPGDLALSMRETPGHTDSMPSLLVQSARVEAAMEKAIRLIVDAGKTAGIRLDLETIDRYVSQGVTLLYDHADNMLLRGAMQFLGEMRNASQSTLRARTAPQYACSHSTAPGVFRETR
jgi:4-hydroxy-2-oxoheptanedioate aldolase